PLESPNKSAFHCGVIADLLPSRSRIAVPLPIFPARPSVSLVVWFTAGCCALRLTYLSSPGARQASGGSQIPISPAPAIRRLRGFERPAPSSSVLTPAAFKTLLSRSGLPLVLTALPPYRLKVPWEAGDVAVLHG
ncbi:unnamed protein product, partial [Urochloa humidicola]